MRAARPRRSSACSRILGYSYMLAVGLGMLAGAVSQTLAQGTPPDPLLDERGGQQSRFAAQWGPVREWWQTRRQNVGKIDVTWDNMGMSRAWADYCYEPSGYHAVEYPKGSHNEIPGFQLWIGGVKNEDTVVSVMQEELLWFADSSRYVAEIWPLRPPEADFIERTTRERLDIGVNCGSILFDEHALSEYDLLSIATDTIVDPNITGYSPFDQRRHKPLGIKVTASRYAWSYDYSEDFVIVEYKVENIGFRDQTSPVAARRIEDLMIGVLVQGWASNYNTRYVHPWRRSHGSLIGRLLSATLPGQTDLTDNLNLMWIANSDGGPENSQFDSRSTTVAFGVRVLSPDISDVLFSFNWWTRTGVMNPLQTWGPVRIGSQVEFVVPNLGRPVTDRGKYQIMSNWEVDYPVVEAAITHHGWHPPPDNATEIAGGALPWGLLSFGPYDLDYGDTITFAIAIVGGEDFHTNPQHFAQTFDPFRPEAYMEGLDLTDLIQNARWAGWMYDTPGLDTDGDGNAGEYYIVGLDTIYHRGDGVPDLTGPPPPPAPSVKFTTRAGEVYLHWNGRNTETRLDPFLNRRDFEGYRIYMSRTGRAEDWLLLTQRDLVNYARYTWIPYRGRWEIKDPPFSRDSLKAMYDSLSMARYGCEFEPDSFKIADLDEALLEVHFDPDHPTQVDSFYRYFTRFDANAMPDDRGLADAVGAHLPVFGVIRKVDPDADTSDVEYRDDGSEYSPYYEYEYAITGLQVAEPVFFSVTAFDHGDPASGLKSLESAKDANALDLWPVNSADVVSTERPKPGVYPNPYRLIDAYNAAGWENPRGLEPDPERARKVTFYNVPDTCTVSIWSLDGDLVKKLDHWAHPSSSEASVVVWNLITRNTQAVKTGIYIWSVESRFGTDVGKLVIIK